MFMVVNDVTAVTAVATEAAAAVEFSHCCCFCCYSASLVYFLSYFTMVFLVISLPRARRAAATLTEGEPPPCHLIRRRIRTNCYNELALLCSTMVGCVVVGNAFFFCNNNNKAYVSK